MFTRSLYILCQRKVPATKGREGETSSVFLHRIEPTGSIAIIFKWLFLFNGSEFSFVRCAGVCLQGGSLFASDETTSGVTYSAS